jgi:hypothetical protein
MLLLHMHTNCPCRRGRDRVTPCDSWEAAMPTAVAASAWKNALCSQVHSPFYLVMSNSGQYPISTLVAARSE